MKKRCISLYTGAGGLDLGFEAAGYKTQVAIEMDPHACATLRHNRPEWALIERDIHSVSSEEILNLGNLQEGDADVLIGGPPCQPFSKSGYWANGDAKRLEDPRSTTLEAYLRVLAHTKPKVFLLENVVGLAYQKKNEGMVLLRKTIESINKECGTSYTFEAQVLNAAMFGVPQERERVFIVGHREGATFRFPEPTHTLIPRGGAHETQGSQLQLPDLHHRKLATTAWDAIGDLEEDNDPELQVTGKWAELLPSIPEGCNYLYHTSRGEGLPLFGWRTRYWSYLLKLAKSYPSWTITAQPGSAIGPFHWKNRRLSMRELARLQTFPDDFQVLGSLRSAQKQIGNAVPSLMAEILGREIAQQFLAEPVGKTPPTLLPKKRLPVPQPVTVREVPSQYLSLLGDHPDHPGTGLGPGAQTRDS